MKNNYIKYYYDSNGRKNKRSNISIVLVFCYSIIKRLLDLLIALTGIILLLPLIIIIAILIKIDSKGPALFKQKRIGKNCKPFILYKFRSCTEDNDMLDFNSSDKVTKMGHFLRKTSLDELPQLFNVLKGDMSLVGPRPWISEYYDHMNSVQKHRADVKPGLTGLAQVNGRELLNIVSRIDYDLLYIKKYSVFIDVFIIIKTVIIIFKNHGSNQGKDEIIYNIDYLDKYNKKGKNEKKKNN